MTQDKLTRYAQARGHLDPENDPALVKMLDGDRDLAAYRAALKTAESELHRLTLAHAKGPRSFAPQLAFRMRFLRLAIDGLRELVKEPPTH